MTYPAPDELMKRLVVEFEYPVPRAESAAAKLLNLQPQLRSPFERWWRTGEMPEIEIEEYTLDRLMSELSLNPIAAFLALDWLIRQPQQAKQSLKRGFDRIVTP